MTAQLSLMVTPTRLETTVEGLNMVWPAGPNVPGPNVARPNVEGPNVAPPNVEGPPQFYVLRNAVWREVPVTAAQPGGRPTEVRASIEAVLASIMRNPAADPRPALQRKFAQIWSKFLPELVQRELADLPRADDDPPSVMLYVHPSLEWIPWELMHDGTDYLGLRYVIARLPIVRHGPRLIGDTRAVKRVCSFLGEHVMDEAQRTEWEATFNGLPAGVAVEQFPTNGAWPDADMVTQAASADILHITCHGGIEDEVFESVWTLNHQGEAFQYGLSQMAVDQMNFAEQGPLVFGNACQGAAGALTATGLTPGLACSFFDHGAVAFVGAFAPISKALALKFAAAFYGHLLGDALTIGSALWRTKVDFKTANEQDPSWLFYCLYGSPDTRFVAGP